MGRSLIIDARWDGDANVWIATSHDVAGLVVEGDIWATMIEETRVVLSDLLDASGRPSEQLTLVFRAEEHLDLAAS